MEDPWATGSSAWAPVKPSQTLDSMNEPASSFDESDPWGAGASTARIPPADALSKLSLSPVRARKDSGWGEEGLGEWEAKMEVPATPGEEEEVIRPSSPVLETPELPSTDISTGEPSSWVINDGTTYEPPPEETSTAKTPSEGGWGGDERPFTPPSPELNASRPAAQDRWGEEDIEEALQAESKPPPISFTPPPAFESPKFEPFSHDLGDGGFGGFSSTITTFPNEAEGDVDEDDGWGGMRGPVIMAGEQTNSKEQEEDWEEVQRRLKVAEDRVPREKVDRLRNDWKEVVLTLVADQLEALTEEEERKLADGVRNLESETYEKLRSLSMIPPDINTYPPVISSLLTHERHAYALSRPNPNPSTSIIVTSSMRRPRRTQGITSDSPWLSRSKLGEPDAPAAEAVAPAEATSSKWSFWRKSAPEKQLVTSGGGVLEVKTPITPAFSRTSSETKVTSRPGSIMSITPRPASPAINTSAVKPNDSNDQLSSASADPGTSSSFFPSTATPSAPVPAPAPSAVSRIWGRFGRKASTPQIADAGDTKDMEISANEFNFLSEIPSLQGEDHHAVGDLLSVEPGRSEEIASLESMLSSKATPLPAPLAPPPRMPPMPRVPSAGGGRFVAKMSSAPSDMDLLGGLDFDVTPSSSSAPPPPVAKQSPDQGSSSSLWEDFLAPTPTAKSIVASSRATPISQQLSQPSIAPPPPVSSTSIPPPTLVATPPPPQQATKPTSMLPPSTTSRIQPPSIQPIQATPSTASSPSSTVAPQSNLSPSSTFTLPSFQPSATSSKAFAPSHAQSSSTLAAPSSFDDFDDFGTPQKASVAKFDDFDFSAFDSPMKHNPIPTPSKPAVQPQSHNQSPGHKSRSSLDHTPTLNLMSEASANKGKRWPAPASPIGPILEPPPKAVSQTGFPFLSPPPPSGAPSRGSSRGVDLLGERSNIQVASGMVPTPPRGSTPVVPPSILPPQSTSTSKHATSGSGTGLSASDLSFFDSL